MIEISKYIRSTILSSVGDPDPDQQDPMFFFPPGSGMGKKSGSGVRIRNTVSLYFLGLFDKMEPPGPLMVAKLNSKKHL